MIKGGKIINNSEGKSLLQRGVCACLFMEAEILKKTIVSTVSFYFLIRILLFIQSIKIQLE